MGMPCFTKVIILEKTAKDQLNKFGERVTYYNLKVASKEKQYESQLIGVPKEVYDQVKEGNEYQLKGEFGGLKTKYWKFDKVI